MTAMLPRPLGRQKEVLALPAAGHTVVLGTAGSGKTTLALHRAAYLANPATDHAGRTLLVTFNKCLVAYLQALGGDDRDLACQLLQDARPSLSSDARSMTKR
jgi:RecA/RadA recombinase